MAVASFQIVVPRKTAGGQLPITKVKAVVAVNTDAAVTFQISDPQAAAVTRTIGPLSPGSAASLVAFTPAPAGAPDADALRVVSPSAALGATDPLRRRYEFFFDLNTDFNPNAFCANLMGAATETWTITVTAGPQITSVCLQSFDQNVAGQQCAGIERLVPVAEPTADVPVFPNETAPCGSARPGVDAVLVLDRSGSMSSSTLGGAPQAKIDALHEAVTDFVTVWNNLRAGEGVGAPADNIGINTFEGDAAWWPAIPNGLNNFAAQQAAILANVNTIAPGGSTSIGDGLILADGVLNSADATRRRAILLMSDGQQNTDRMVAVIGGQVVTHTLANPAATTALPNQSKYQIYSVTVGTGAAVSAQINQDVATATKGFYINSEDNAGQMSPFFLELLQNFVRFNSWETYRMLSGQVRVGQPFATTLRVTSTTQHLVVHLRWPSQHAALRLTVKPPDGGDAHTSVSSRAITMRFEIPTTPTYDYRGLWQIAVVAADASAEAVIPFELVVLGEDGAFDSELNITPADHVPGQDIELTARLSEFGRPLTGLAAPGATLVARVVKPGESIGDLLSQSQASSSPPANADKYTAADAKLFNELQKNPGALKRDASDTVTLVDAGDGVYRGRYRVQTPGHYNFLIGVAGAGHGTGNFERMQLKTAWVRPAPDANATVLQTGLAPRGNILLVKMTPRTQFGNNLGPGWANYFWFKAPGLPAVKPVDNLDGTYSASIPFTGSAPLVSMHFLPVSMVIGDSVTENQLPVPLDDSNALVPVVGAPGCLRGLPKWLVALILGLLVLLGILWKRRQS